MAGNAELCRVGEFHRCIETTPKDNPAKTTNNE
jgi:hypothetical protein